MSGHLYEWASVRPHLDGLDVPMRSIVIDGREVHGLAKPWEAYERMCEEMNRTIRVVQDGSFLVDPRDHDRVAARIGVPVEWLDWDPVKCMFHWRAETFFPWLIDGLVECLRGLCL